MVFPEVHRHLVELMTDLFGNYLCQRIFRRCSSEQRLSLLEKLGSSTPKISCDRQGTRVMQKVVQYATDPAEVCHFWFCLVTRFSKIPL